MVSGKILGAANRRAMGASDLRCFFEEIHAI